MLHKVGPHACRLADCDTRFKERQRQLVASGSTQEKVICLDELRARNASPLPSGGEQSWHQNLKDSVLKHGVLGKNR